MNRLKSSHQCRVCRDWLEPLYTKARSDAERESALRQMDNGMCDECQRKRWAAAVEYLRAADQIRVVTRMFARAAMKTPSPHLGLMFELRSRVHLAEARCVALKMWHPIDLRPERLRAGRQETK
jgi:hypothetical protein